MKKVTYLLALIALSFTTEAISQDQPQVVKLSQVEGEFTDTELALKSGTFVFEVTNASVNRAVGLVVAETNADGTTGAHIPTAYLSKTIALGETATSQSVTLKPGTYKYFCPLNPTPEYTITVSE